MAKAIKTIRQPLHYRPQLAAYFASNQALFNQVAAFYFEVIQAHEKVLDLSTKEALIVLETLTHTTANHPYPAMPLSNIAANIPVLFRRAAISAAIGSARAFYTHLRKWRKRKEQTAAKGKKFSERPPVPPRTWNKSVPFYAGQWKERESGSIMLKVWTGACWGWVKVQVAGREFPSDYEAGSPSLVRKGKQWWLHTPVEKRFKGPAKIVQQIRENKATKLCAIDLNLDGHIAVCTIQTVEGTILATKFIGGGKEISGFRKRLLGRIARNRSKTGIMAEGEQDNVSLWRKIRRMDEQVAHQVSARIVQFAYKHGASILVFEHLSRLKPEKGKYSRRSNTKRAYWMKGRIFEYAKYKAYHQGILTSRINPRNTSRECHRCQNLVIRYRAGQSMTEYTPGTPLAYCEACGMAGHADWNASIVIGQRLLARYQTTQEKPQAPLPRVEREPKGSGVALSQEAKGKKKPSFSSSGRHGRSNGSGTTQKQQDQMGSSTSAIPRQLRLPME
jgi:IS605 OrfB family transposase